MHNRFVRLAVCVALLGACASPGPSGQPEPSPETPSPSPSVSVADLGDLAPPDFEGGGLGIWTKSKFFAVHEEPSPDSESTKLKAWNPLGQRIRLLVLDTHSDSEGTGWFEVMVPERPNGSTGWIQSEPKSMQADELPDRIEVDLSEFKLEYYRFGRLVHEFQVGIGEDRYPTPTGSFFVWASVPQPEPSGPYGRFALGLSGFSPVLSDWPGGGRSAIHGTATEADKGAEVSHGCVRVYNPDMRKLQKVPLGTPVLIEE